MSNEQGFIEVVSDADNVFFGPAEFEKDFSPIDANDEMESKNGFFLSKDDISEWTTLESSTWKKSMPESPS